MKTFSNKIKALHRDLGYFVIGLTLIYALSGIILSGRGLEWFYQDFKDELIMEKNIKTDNFNNAFINKVLEGKVKEVFPKKSYESVKKSLKLKLSEKSKEKFVYKAWKTLVVSYDSNKGETFVTYRGYPMVVKIFLDAHKTSHKKAWFYLAIIYSVILSFLAISSFWMIKGKNGFRKRGVYFMFAGFIVIGLFLALA